MNTFKIFAASALVSLVTLGAGVAHAQDSLELNNVDSPPRKAIEVAQVTGTISTDAGGGAAGGETDHSQVVGTFGIGFLGFRGMSLGAVMPVAVEAPVIGARYWLDEGMGLDFGLGLSIGSGSTETVAAGVTTEGDAPVPTTFILHGGVPFALASSEHFVFQVVPEINLGMSSMTVKDPAGLAPDTDVSGTHFSIGARAGAEIHFGFIDIPELALQAGVGLTLAMESGSNEAGPAKTSVSRTVLSTGHGDDPWDIFAANIAAMYYFSN
ncbi:MAG: hypothetical protein RJA70_3870 [Pseudomonadota bacterium]|jgi:hypothetical protein